MLHNKIVGGCYIAVLIMFSSMKFLPLYLICTMTL